MRWVRTSCTAERSPSAVRAGPVLGVCTSRISASREISDAARARDTPSRPARLSSEQRSWERWHM